MGEKDERKIMEREATTIRKRWEARSRDIDPKIGSSAYNLNRCSFEGSIDRTERAERPGTGTALSERDGKGQS